MPIVEDNLSPILLLLNSIQDFNSVPSIMFLRGKSQPGQTYSSIPTRATCYGGPTRNLIKAIRKVHNFPLKERKWIDSPRVLFRDNNTQFGSISFATPWRKRFSSTQENAYFIPHCVPCSPALLKRFGRTYLWHKSL